MFLFFVIFCILLSNNIWAAKPTIAIFNFRPINIQAIGYDGEILYSLITSLTEESSVEILPRREMEQTLLNAGLVQSDNLETAIKAGKVLNVNYIVVGQVEKEGLKIKTKIHLINVSQGCIQKTWSPVFNGRDDILNKIPEFAKKIVQTINLAVPIEIKKEQRKTYISHLKAEVDKDKRSILLTWDFDPSDPITRFNVYRSENRDGPYQLIGSTNKNLI